MRSGYCLTGHRAAIIALGAAQDLMAMDEIKQAQARARQRRMTPS